MIQRIQTIWLLISAISSGFLMKGGIVYFVAQTGQKYFTGFSGIFRLTDSGQELIKGSVPLSLIIILIPIASVISILLYKSRRIQKLLTLILIAFAICSIILLTYYSFLVIKNYDTGLVPGIKMFIPMVILIASILAYRGIIKDDRLVKSYDRLR
jgi:hypothetical protein